MEFDGHIGNDLAALAAQVAHPPAGAASKPVPERSRAARRKPSQPEQHQTATLLIACGDQRETELLCEMMKPTGYSATCFSSAEAALAAVRQQPFDLALVDLAMPGTGGIAFLRAAREIDADMVGILMTSQKVSDTLEQTEQVSVQDLLIKPFGADAVLPLLARALHERRLRLENIHLEQAVALYELSIRLTLDCDAVLQKVADAAVGHTQVRGVSMLVPAEAGRALRVAVVRGEYVSRDMDKRIPFGRVTARWVARSLKRVSRMHELADREAPLPISFVQLPGSISIPMLAGGGLVGILNFFPRNAGRPVSPAQTKALNVLASAGATALMSASLFELMRSAESRYRNLAESAGDIIFRFEVNPTTRLVYANPALTAVLGYSPAEVYADAEPVEKIVHPDDRDLYRKILKGAFVSGSTATFRCIHRNGTTVWLEQRSNLVRDANKGDLVAIEGIARDVTERRLLENQLRQSQKMEAIGLLAGGVAHDFNNLLTVILGYSDLVIGSKELCEETAEQLAQVTKAAHQAAALTRQLLSFGRNEPLRKEILNINSVVANSSKILRRTIGEDIEFVIDPSADLGLIKADARQVEQILMNLAVNARGALPRGGRITIETRNITVNGPSKAECLSGHGGPHVMLAVTDNGCGMEPATVTRIFEPFYTTKELGNGTGLGLSIVYGIVKQAGGHIRVYSEPGIGTRFEILFPRTDEPAELSVPAAVHKEVPVGSETVLVVEDDAGVRQLVSDVLKKSGYDVLIAREGNEALRICAEHGSKVGLILTDLIMPGMSGPALVESLKNLNPAMRILCMSGYAPDALAGHGFVDPGVPLIQKPFTSLDLIVRVGDVLRGEKEVPATMHAQS